MRRMLLVALALAAVAGGIWYWGAPQWTIGQMRDAAKAGDTDRLAGYVDFPALRASLKDEVRTQARGDGSDDPGTQLAVTIGTQLIDRIVTPKALGSVFAGSAGGRSPIKIDATAPDMTLRRTDFDNFEFAGRKAGGGALLFTRLGLGWKLTGMRLPRRS